jgi:hypothetical protein
MAEWHGSLEKVRLRRGIKEELYEGDEGMIETKSHELQKLINTCYEAVEKSNVGPMHLMKDGLVVLDPNGAPIVKTLAYHTYLHLVSALAPKAEYKRSVDGELKEVKNV